MTTTAEDLREFAEWKSRRSAGEYEFDASPETFLALKEQERLANEAQKAIGDLTAAIDTAEQKIESNKDNPKWLADDFEVFVDVIRTTLQSLKGDYDYAEVRTIGGTTDVIRVR